MSTRWKCIEPDESPCVEWCGGDECTIDAPAEPVGGTLNTYSPTHPHEPAIPPCLAEDGHCRICRLLVNLTDVEKRAEKAEHEVAGLRADAERYQFLKSQLVHSDKLDAEIDRQRRPQGAKE